jgi:hypothetical protein
MAQDNSVQDINSVLGFLFELGAKVEQLIQKGSISFLDLPGMIGIFEGASPALAALKSLPADLKQINDADLASIRAYVQTQLPTVLPNASLDALIGSGLAQAQSLYDFIESLKAAKNPAPTPAPAAAPAP